MNFELGKEYIVSVTEKGIIPLTEFDKDRWFDKDTDDLDFLTDEEKIIVAKKEADKIRAEILNYQYNGFELGGFRDGFNTAMVKVLNIVDKHRGQKRGINMDRQKYVNSQEYRDGYDEGVEDGKKQIKKQIDCVNDQIKKILSILQNIEEVKDE